MVQLLVPLLQPPIPIVLTTWILASLQCQYTGCIQSLPVHRLSLVFDSHVQVKGPNMQGRCWGVVTPILTVQNREGNVLME